MTEEKEEFFWRIGTRTGSGPRGPQSKHDIADTFNCFSKHPIQDRSYRSVSHPPADVSVRLVSCTCYRSIFLILGRQEMAITTRSELTLTRGKRLMMLGALITGFLGNLPMSCFYTWNCLCEDMHRYQLGLVRLFYWVSSDKGIHASSFP